MHLVPNSFGVELREFNPCHDPKSGRFSNPRLSPGCYSKVHSSRLVEPSIPPKAAREKALAYIKRRGVKRFSVQKAMRMLGPEFSFVLGRMMATAQEAHTELQEKLGAAMTAIGGDVVGSSQEAIVMDGRPKKEPGPIKGARRSIVKALEDYDGDLSQVVDVVRATIAVDHPDQIEGLLRALGQAVPNTRVKRFVDKESQYRDIKINVRLSNGTAGEIIVATKDMLAAKDFGGGHKLYESWRKLSDGDPRRPGLMRQMRALYEVAYARALQRAH